MTLSDYFERVVVINLRRRPDRLRRFYLALEECQWPFKIPDVTYAVDGSKVPAPSHWKSGSGAWGCMRSHQRILEDALSDGIGTLLILEDDACFVPNFVRGVTSFLSLVPSDWDQLMLGGQHVNTHGCPELLPNGIYRCSDCERTHAYAIRPEFASKLYKRWLAGGEFNGEVHCDWIMGRDRDMQSAHRVYAPRTFLIGQERDYSDISGGTLPRKFWNPPAKDLSVIYLQAPANIVRSLRDFGFHTGHSRDPVTDIDVGLSNIFADPPQSNREQRLRQWIHDLQWEVASDPYLICAVWHPQATLDEVKRASDWDVTPIASDSLEGALAKLPHHLRRKRRRYIGRHFVIVFSGPKHVLDYMRQHGWHSGHWRNSSSGIDFGLESAVKESTCSDDLRNRLSRLVALLQSEAEAIHRGVAVLWHPRLNFEDVVACSRTEVLHFACEHVREASERWESIVEQFESTEGSLG